jgi:hypothetical protein
MTMYIQPDTLAAADSSDRQAAAATRGYVVLSGHTTRESAGGGVVGDGYQGTPGAATAPAEERTGATARHKTVYKVRYSASPPPTPPPPGGPTPALARRSNPPAAEHNIIERFVPSFLHSPLPLAS